MPVRIMVPVDLRKMFPSRTFRNFILFVLPTMEVQDAGKPFHTLLGDFGRQIQAQTEKERLASILTAHVRAQHSPLFRVIPRAVKSRLMAFIYRFSGEINSSITLTNLGRVTLPAEMESYVRSVDVALTPRRNSQYNCGIISYGDNVCINISRFRQEPELETIFIRRLNALLQE